MKIIKKNELRFQAGNYKNKNQKIIILKQTYVFYYDTPGDIEKRPIGNAPMNYIA